jgi:hypothetical protein
VTIEQLDAIPKGRVRALTGMPREALAELFLAVLPELEARRLQRKRQRERKRGVGAGPKRRLSAYQEVLIVLIYLRHNLAHQVVGQMFGVSADTSENLFHELVPLLRELCPATRFEAEKRWKKGEPSWTPEQVDRVLIDTFETSVPRPSTEPQQKRLYSGKKKRHTLKTQVATTTSGEILDIDAGHRGPASDKTIFEHSAVDEQFPQATPQGDLGSQGATGMTIPHKTPKGGALTPAQKDENRQRASVRVHVEHSIRRIKGFKIVRENYRHATGLFPMVASAVVGLVQMVRIIE